MDPSTVPAGGIPWLLAAPAFVFLVGVAIAVVKWIALRADKKIEDAEERVNVASKAKEDLRLEYQKRLDDAERRADALEKSFREHLEHDARVFRGETERRNPSRHSTGDATLDAKRRMTESITGSLPADVVAKVRGMIDRGEIGG